LKGCSGGIIDVLSGNLYVDTEEKKKDCIFDRRC
jgi:hypothetical protein